MRIKKFNESLEIESGHMTIGHAIEAAEVRNFDISEIDECIDERELDRDLIFTKREIFHFDDGGYYLWVERYNLFLIYEKNKDVPKASLFIYDPINPFVFNNMLVVPQREKVFLYDLVKNEYKTEIEDFIENCKNDN